MSVFNPLESRASRPDWEIEKRSAVSGDVITRKMTPEEMAKFDELRPLKDRDGRIRKQPVALSMGAERRRKLEKLKREAEEAEQDMTKGKTKNNLTVDEYLNLRLEGKTRTEIISSYFSGPNPFYEQLVAWGLKDLKVENKALEDLRSKNNSTEASKKMIDVLKQKDDEIARLRESVKEIAKEANQNAARAEELENKLKIAQSYTKEDGITLDEYQRDASRTADTDWDQIAVRIIRGNNVLPLLNFALGAAGEAGEIADEVKKFVFHGHVLDKDRIVKEIGDTLWYLSQLAKVCGTSLDEVARKNIEKLKERYPDGFSEARSQNRNAG